MERGDASHGTARCGSALRPLGLPEVTRRYRDDGTVEPDQDRLGRPRSLERLQPQDLRDAGGGREALRAGHPAEKPPGKIRWIDEVAGLIHGHSLHADGWAGIVPPTYED